MANVRGDVLDNFPDRTDESDTISGLRGNDGQRAVAKRPERLRAESRRRLSRSDRAALLCSVPLFALAWLALGVGSALVGAGFARAATTTELDVDRPGGDLNSIELQQADPALCRKACEAEAQCKAYTFVKPGVQGETARCWLKASMPPAVPNHCCVSGVKVAAAGPVRGDSSAGGPSTPDTTIPAGVLGDLIRNHLERIAAFGEDAEAEYQKSLAELRSRAKDIAPVLLTAYSKTPESAYFRRWTLVYTLAELQNPATAPDLATIAQSEIPPEQSPGPDSEFFSVGEEIQIRVAAIEGLSKAGQMDAKIEEALLALMQNEHLGIKRAAVQSYLTAVPAGAQRDARVSKLRSVLPPQDHGLLSLSTTQIHDVVTGFRPETLEQKKPERRKERSAPPQATPLGHEPIR
jgi:PAN domain